MAFKDLPDQSQGVKLLQRSLGRGRLAHACLFTGSQLDALETLARTLAKTLNCQNPRGANSGIPGAPQPGQGGKMSLDSRLPSATLAEAGLPAIALAEAGPAIDCCDVCLACRKIDREIHPDIHWVRPESKSRVILVEQMRDLMRDINLKPTEAEYKVAVIVAADRLRTEAANAFLKTLEEPPPKSVLLLLSTEPQRILDTILSRCARLNFGGEGQAPMDAAQREWLARFSELAAAGHKSLLGRYRLMDVLLQLLSSRRAKVEEDLTARSPLRRYEDADKELRDKWEEELAAAIEAEYRRQRADLLLALQWWMRDVWLRTLAVHPDSVSFPDLKGTEEVARRLNPRSAVENLQILEQIQRLLYTNVQEALAIEVGLLKLHL